MEQKKITAFFAALILAMFSTGSCAPVSKTSSSSFSSFSAASSASAAMSQPEPQSSGSIGSADSVLTLSSEISSAASSAPKTSVASSKTANPDSSLPASSQAASQTESSVPSGPVKRVYSPDTPETREIVYGADVRSGEEGGSVDCSNLSEGYIIVKYGGSGAGGRLKAQLIKSGGTTYNYDIAANKNEILPLNQGSGTYTVNIVEGIGGSSYAVMFSCVITAELRSDFLPYLYSNQFVDFASAPNTKAKAEELAKGISTDVELTSAIFDYVTKTIVYDYEFAKTVKTGYIPVLDNVLSAKKGICFDYASLMAGMLRYNRIPCKLVIGYTGDAYHAWIDVWLDGKGWISGIILYDGHGWLMMDPTYVAAYRSNAKLNSLYSKVVTYTEKYHY
ncbi:MAG TPA: transglutaminase-like domain-containing protein [Oscillospiraceae bacterium]|nr:transglutaminase-like domain-containing protein [Oscillospiraceae bacterium]HPS35074.1 transglutaminase-like domain-containing protein [Oscillospiraceae bacterium]